MTIAEELARTIIDPKAYSEREVVDAAFAKLRAALEYAADVTASGMIAR